ncbi:MAG: ABC transporter permease [Victivallaceae bacterium]|nr:ABC transporter permease [Victivallaceae bacterium]
MKHDVNRGLIRLALHYRDFREKMRAPLEFIGAVSGALPLLFRKKGLRKKEFRYYLDLCGVQSLPITLLITFLMGCVLGIQSALQLTKFGAEIFTADLVGFAVLKEFGPLMVAIILTGRAGSAFAAELGTMKVNEEISALETMGIRPVGYLVLPKLTAMVIAMPLLTIFGDVAGIFGGLTIGITLMDLPFAAYWSRTIDVLDGITMMLGVFKSVVFAVLITVSGCYYGFRSSSDAQGVGRSATQAVVASIFYVIVADAMLTVLYSFIGY